MSEAVWYTYPFLLAPRRIAKNLEVVAASGLVEPIPNLWQLSLGVVRMWHRLAFRSETVGMSPGGVVRDSWRARLLRRRPLRFPFLLAERAVAPLDLTGLMSHPERTTRHLLGAHHDRDEFVYDLEILGCHPGRLEELRRRVAEIVDEDTPRARWMKDLVVFEGYHERLLAALDDILENGLRVRPVYAANPDYCFAAYLRWCAAQPATPGATLRALARGEYSAQHGLRGAMPA